MASEGPNSAGAAADAGLDTAWSNVGNVFSSDNVYATVTLGAFGLSNFIICTQFGFAIPTGATINGIVAEFEYKASSGASITPTARLIKGGIATGLSKNGSAIGTSDAYATYGSSSDLWSATLSASDVNATNFGVRIVASSGSPSSITVSVDHVRLTVYYTDAAAGQPTMRRFSQCNNGLYLPAHQPLEVGRVGTTFAKSLFAIAS